jgi:hypothetical protein
VLSLLKLKPDNTDVDWETKPTATQLGGASTAS